MNETPGQFQNSYKRNWRQQKCSATQNELYESHGLQRDQTKVLQEDTPRSLINRMCDRQANVAKYLKSKLDLLIEIRIYTFFVDYLNKNTILYYNGYLLVGLPIGYIG